MATSFLAGVTTIKSECGGARRNCQPPGGGGTGTSSECRVCLSSVCCRVEGGGWVDGWMDGWVGRWVDGWMDDVPPPLAFWIPKGQGASPQKTLLRPKLWRVVCVCVWCGSEGRGRRHPRSVRSSGRQERRAFGCVQSDVAMQAGRLMAGWELA
jgi:hypothetical protein